MASTLTAVRFCGRKSLHKSLKTCQNILTKTETNVASVQAVDTAEYPSIKPRYPPGKWGKLSEKRAWAFWDRGVELNNIPTVKERLESISGTEDIPMFILKQFDNVPNNLKNKQNLFKTHIEYDLPETLKNVSLTDSQYNLLKPYLLECILSTHEEQFLHRVKPHHLNKREVLGNKLTGDMLTVALSLLSSQIPHLYKCQTDEDVRIETFWKKCGFEKENMGDVSLKNVDQDGCVQLQYLGKANYQIRCHSPLPEFISQDDPLCNSLSYASELYPPNTAAVMRKYRRPISVSGHWIEDPCEFTHTSYYVTNTTFERLERDVGPKAGQQKSLELGVSSGFASTAAQAHNQGFNMYWDVTYPFTTQTVVTNGQWFQFGAYQLNTLFLWKDDEANPLQNIAWSSPQQKLYDVVENGEVKGLNEEVLKQFIKYLILPPVDRNVNLRPYLPDETAPKEKTSFINHKGEEPPPHTPVGRWQYPKHPVYF